MSITRLISQLKNSSNPSDPISPELTLVIELLKVMSGQSSKLIDDFVASTAADGNTEANAFLSSLKSQAETVATPGGASSTDVNVSAPFNGGEGNVTLNLRKVGNQVTLGIQEGSFTGIDDLINSDGTIDVIYRPIVDTNFLTQVASDGAGSLGLVTIFQNGFISIAKDSSGNSFPDGIQATWLPFSVSYPTAISG